MTVKNIALIGNPNVGKSTVFNGLTGLSQHTGNWPGKTVSLASGTYVHRGQAFSLIDLPGIYSLTANSPEEEVAIEYLNNKSPDAVVVVVDATCMERNLNLALQVAETYKNVVLCVNLLDEANKKGIEIDLDSLSRRMNIPVVGVVARSKKNLDKLKDQILALTKKPMSSSPIPPITKELSEEKIMDYLNRASELYRACVRLKRRDYNAPDRTLDNIVTSKSFGYTIMLLLLALVFWITLRGANYISDFLHYFLFEMQDRLFLLLTDLNAPAQIVDLVVFGIYQTVAWVVSVMLPPMAIFFPLFTLLEDLGYLPRVAFNLDNFFKKACAHGKQALTMCMGFGCNAAGIIGCRIIDSPRERLIAIITNNFVPCNGRFPTLIALSTIFIAGSFGKFQTVIAALTLLGAIIIGVLITLAVSRILSATILKGIPSTFTLELPPYRKPQVGKILIRSLLDRTLFVLARAVIVAAPTGLIIWLMANTTVENLSILKWSGKTLEPIGHLLGMDGYILLAFILGFPANEIVIPIIAMSYMATGSLIEIETLSALKELLIDNGWTYLTAVCTMLFSLNHFPCGTTLLTIYKETQSLKWTAISFLVPTITGIIICFIVAQTIRCCQIMMLL